MTYTTFLYIITPICIFICACLIGIIKSNTKSHKELWQELNDFKINYAKLEQKFIDKVNGKGD